MCSEDCVRSERATCPATRPAPVLLRDHPQPWLRLLVLGPVLFGLAGFYEKWDFTPSKMFNNRQHMEDILKLSLQRLKDELCRDGCIRRSLFHHAPPTTPPPAMDTTTTINPSHKMACFPDEEQDISCLHGGTCYAILLNDKRTTTCECPDEWTGPRCSLFFIDPNLLPYNQDENMRTANIASGLSVCILVVFVALLAVYVYLRYRRKQRLLGNREFEATVEELYRQPFCPRSSVVESLSRPGSVRRAAPSGKDGAGGSAEVRVDVEEPDPVTILPLAEEPRSGTTYGSGKRQDNGETL